MTRWFGPLAFVLAVAPHAVADDGAPGRIRPWTGDPRYWQYDGRPVRLVGGSKDDNLFQLPDLEAHLDEIAAAGGNYVRNTMSDRRDRGHEVYPFLRLEDGKFDLERWNEEYWGRFERLLRLAEERGIVVQVEVWDRFDYSRDHWPPHPYNPRNNVNYTAEEAGLATDYPKHPGANEQPFFSTVPALDDNETVLRHQRAQVDRMLSYALGRPNVLYCIDNETSGAEEWSTYWAEHIRRRAGEAGVEVFITEMWDDHDVKGGRHARTFDHPARYDFVDVSQNNHNSGQGHWDNLMWVRDRVADPPRPINHVKIYGADTGPYGTTRDGTERFWRCLIGGAASARFHRPDSGIGLDETARRHLAAFRMLEAECDLTRCEPDATGRRLSDREPDEAYLTCEPGEQYVVYFPDGGRVGLDLGDAAGRFRVRWLDVEAGDWRDAGPADGPRRLDLEAPGEGHWVALVTRIP